MVKKEMIAMLLAGGQGSRLGVLTSKVAKPAVSFGGKYRIIDFPLSNCINSGVDTVGVLTQYQPLRLNTHIGIGIPWDLDRNIGGVTVLPPYEKSENSEWYTGTANAIYQNIDYMESFNPDYVLILSGDHIYKMDYEVMLDYHKQHNAECTIAVMPVPMEEAKRFGIMITDENGKITDFEEKPANPRSNLASMGIYIFNWKTLKEALIARSSQPNLDFGKHVIPYCHENGAPMYAYEFNGYWKDVGTLNSYWEANMELIDIVPEFNLYEEYWKIYTKSEILPPQYIAPEGVIERSIVGEGSEIRTDLQFRHRLRRGGREGNRDPGFHRDEQYGGGRRLRAEQGHRGGERFHRGRREAGDRRRGRERYRPSHLQQRHRYRGRKERDPQGRFHREEHGRFRRDGERGLPGRDPSRRKIYH